MQSQSLETLRHHEIPGRVAIATGNGGLPKVVITSPGSTAEIYLNGAHITHFQKNGEPPLIFMSAKSHFAPGKAIRGGVPICYPWFGNREGGPSHGFARSTEWLLVKTTAAPEGAVTVTFALPGIEGSSHWNSLRTEFTVTVADTLTMELTTANESCDGAVEFEECLHTYFQVGDIRAITLTGLEDAGYLDFAFGANGALKPAEHAPIKIGQETNRSYFNTASTVELHDEKLQRTVRVEKFNSRSTVVWNPWTTQKLPDDFDPAEHAQMVCVESGNVKQHTLSLGPGQETSLKVVLRSGPLK